MVKPPKFKTVKVPTDSVTHCDTCFFGQFGDSCPLPTVPCLSTGADGRVTFYVFRLAE